MAEDSSPENSGDAPAAAAATKPAKATGRVSKRIKIITSSAIFAGVAAPLILAALFFLGNHIKDQFNQPEGQPVGQPVKIDLVTESPAYGDTQVFSAPMAPSQLAALKSLDIDSPEYEQWFINHGAAASGHTIITVAVQGNRDNTVQIIGIEPTQPTCSPPLSGTLIYLPPAGGVEVTRLALNLDNPLAKPGYFVGYGETNPLPDYFLYHKIYLKRGEQFTFTVDASTVRQYCAFKLDMTVLDDGHSSTEPVSDNGQPFRVTAPLKFASYKTVYVYATDYRGNSKVYVAGWVRVNPSTYKG